MHYVKIINRSGTIHKHDKLFLDQQIPLAPDLSELPSNGTYGQIYRIKLTYDGNKATWHFYWVVLSKNERELVETTLDSQKSSIDAVGYMSRILEAYGVRVGMDCNTAHRLAHRCRRYASTFNSQSAIAVTLHGNIVLTSRPPELIHISNSWHTTQHRSTSDKRRIKTALPQQPCITTIYTKSGQIISRKRSDDITGAKTMRRSHNKKRRPHNKQYFGTFRIKTGTKSQRN